MTARRSFCEHRPARHPVGVALGVLASSCLSQAVEADVDLIGLESVYAKQVQCAALAALGGKHLETKQHLNNAIGTLELLSTEYEGCPSGAIVTAKSDWLITSDDFGLCTEFCVGLRFGVEHDSFERDMSKTTEYSEYTTALIKRAEELSQKYLDLDCADNGVLE